MRFSKRRVALALIAAVCLLPLTVQKSASGVLDSGSPALALEIDPSNPVAHSRKALRAVFLDPTNPDIEEAERSAIKALPGTPRDSTALAILAFTAAFREEDYDLFLEQANRFSKRDLSVQLFQILVALEEGNVPTATAALDRALTTHPESQEFLTPYLGSLLTSEEGREAVIGYLGADAPWKRAFWTTASNARPVPEYVVPLLEQIGPRETAKLEGIETRLVRALASSGRLEDAVRIVRMNDSLSPPLAGPSNLLVVPEGEPLVPFDWNLSSEATRSAALSTDGMLVTTRSARNGLVASRIVSLPVGEWVISGQASLAGGGGTLALGSRCVGAAGSGSVETFEFGRDGTARIRAALPVPEGCAFQELRLEFDAKGVGRTVVDIPSMQIERRGRSDG